MKDIVCKIFENEDLASLKTHSVFPENCTRVDLENSFNKDYHYNQNIGLKRAC